MRHRRTPRALPLALLLVAGLAACGDSTGPALEESFDPATAQAVMQAQAAIFQIGFAGNTLLLDAMDDLAALGVQFDPVDHDQRLQRLATVVPRARLAAVQPLASFPAELVGTTLVYDPVDEAWVASDRTGAPDNGVRIIWYAVDGTGMILTNQELGYIDLTDESTDAQDLLGIRMVSTDGATEVTFADYTTGYSETRDGDAWTEHFSADGTVSNGTDALTFHVLADGNGNDASGDESYSFAISATGDPGTYTFDVDETLDGATSMYHDVIRSSVTDGTGATTQVDLDYTSDQATLTENGSGTISYQESTVATIEIHDGNYTFKHPDGGTFGANTATRLESLVSTMSLTGFLIIFSMPLLFF